MLKVDFLEEGLGIVSPPHFAYDLFVSKTNLCIFLIKQFFCMTENSRQKFDYLENEKSV